MVTERLCGSMPMTTRVIGASLSEPDGCRAGRAALLRAEQTPLEPLPVQQCPTRAGHERATRRVVGSRCESDGPGTWTEPCAGVDPGLIEQVADVRTCRTAIIRRLGLPRCRHHPPVSQAARSLPAREGQLP